MYGKRKSAEVVEKKPTVHSLQSTVRSRRRGAGRREADWKMGIAKSKVARGKRGESGRVGAQVSQNI